jgi:hypothetical protein
LTWTAFTKTDLASGLDQQIPGRKPTSRSFGSFSAGSASFVSSTGLGSLTSPSRLIVPNPGPHWRTVDSDALDGASAGYPQTMRSDTELIAPFDTRVTTPMRPNTAKSAELQIIIWFLEAGWELFTPVADLYGTDIVVRDPATRKLLAVQVKHKQPGALNEGELLRTWDNNYPSFDYLVFFVPAKLRGLVVPSQKLTKAGKMFIFYKRDHDGYARGPVRPMFRDYAFELAAVPPEQRALAFVYFFCRIHSHCQA